MFGIERRAGFVVGELLELLGGFVVGTHVPVCGVSGKLGARSLPRLSRPLTHASGALRIRFVELRETCLQAENVELVDGEDANATWCTAGLADQPVAAAPLCVTQRGIEDLYERLVLGWESGLAPLRISHGRFSVAARVSVRSIAHTTERSFSGSSATASTRPQRSASWACNFSAARNICRARARADESRQALGAAPSGDESECGAAMSEDGMRTGNAVTAGQSEIESSAHAVAVNGCDGGCGEVGDGLH